MFMIVASRTTMSCARPITPSMSQRRRSSGPALAGELTSDMSFTNLEVSSPLRSTVARSGEMSPLFSGRFQVTENSADGGADVRAVRPLRRDAERNRQRILKAAAEVFNERGLDVSLDEIARHAGVGVGTVYRRFRTKEDLVEALFMSRLATVAAIAEQALEADDPWAGLVSFMERMTETMADDLGLRQILMFATYGRDLVTIARQRNAPLVERLV